ncbi:MAG TPA: sigma 54-interacting transcriptional regulator [Dissulfurispiraceae bacterium]|nr:sigma 54-interacting transcriptional regulator [Dissulfurispiraceae bacterium]
MKEKNKENLNNRRSVPPVATQIILDSIADGVFTVDEEFYITSFNKAAERITGIRASKAIGQKCFDVLHADICQSACALKQTLRTGKEIIDKPVSILNREGALVPISISTAVLKNEKGRIIGGAETFRDLSAIESLRREISRQYSFSDIISKNHEIREIFGILPDIAESESTILIQGESGTGKELFARAIHNLSGRSRRAFVAVNCGALPDNLLESELFGYRRGAFTDAKKDKPGKFALAYAGTLFLDEIADLPLPLQAKLLRVLQEREYEPLGATAPVKSDVRVIAATNQNLTDMVANKTFRDDLFYRLNIVKLDLPPLRERKEDIPILVDHFIAKFNAGKNKNISGISDDVMQLLMIHRYPGNIRELENLLEHAFVMCRGGEIRIKHLPKELRETVAVEPRMNTESLQVQFKISEAEIIKAALNKNHGHRGRTAKELGIDTSTLWRKIKKLRI